MKVIVMIRRSHPQWFLVDLPTNKLVREVATLAGKGRHSQAVAEALARGRFEKELSEGEAANTKASIILTEESIHWDLTAK